MTNLRADAVSNGEHPVASVMYQSLQLGYAVPSIHTKFDVGVDNLSNKHRRGLPERLNYNVDTSTYDALGRYYWARATVSF